MKGLCLMTGMLWAMGAHVQALAQQTHPARWTPWLVDAESLALPGAPPPPQCAPMNRPHGPADLTYWTGVALDLIVKYERNAVKAARTLAYLHVAMHDALILGGMEGLCAAELEAATHIAAVDTLAYMFPAEPESRYETVLVTLLAKASSDTSMPLLASDAPSRKVATRVVRLMRSRASADGAEQVWPINERPAAFEGMFVAPPPLFAFNPLEVWAGRWTSWTDGPDPVLAISPPLVFGSAAYLDELAEVIAVADALNPEQRRIAEDWHLDAGSVTPAGVWNRHALKLAQAQGLDQIATVRLLAKLNVAMMDATIACWRVKYHWWTMRPVTAAALLSERILEPALATPQHPSYVSGHAAISGAAAVVLAGQFPSLASVVHDMAREAAMSRLYGGIHFRSDNEEGLRLGKLIGERVAAIDR
jgi:hypothetical protein